jgi:uridine kinase
VSEFHSALGNLRRTGRCAWDAYDWTTHELGARRELIANGPIVVEGCSVMDPAIAGLYDLRIFVESDRTSVLSARRTRDGGGALAQHWETLFLPSVDLYMRTRPHERADFVIAGRVQR